MIQMVVIKYAKLVPTTTKVAAQRAQNNHQNPSDSNIKGIQLQPTLPISYTQGQNQLSHSNLQHNLLSNTKQQLNKRIQEQDLMVNKRKEGKKTSLICSNSPKPSPHYKKEAQFQHTTLPNISPHNIEGNSYLLQLTTTSNCNTKSFENKNKISSQVHD